MGFLKAIRLLKFARIIIIFDPWAEKVEAIKFAVFCPGTRQQVEFLDGVADFYHIDIMDGHFVPNIALSPFFIEGLKRTAKLPVDAHLMVTRPEAISPLCLSAGADYVCFHAETVDARAFRLIDTIKAALSLVFYSVWPAQWGYDYQAVSRSPFSRRVVRDGAGYTLVEQP